MTDDADPTPPDGRTNADRRDRADEDGDGFGAIRRAALEAELETGHHEASAEEATRNIFVRIAIIATGTFVLLVGLLLLALPGPGLITVAIGLGILATEVPFAARLLERVKQRLPTDADGKLPRSAVVTMIVMAVLATSLSVAWVFYSRG